MLASWSEKQEMEPAAKVADMTTCVCQGEEESFIIGPQPESLENQSNTPLNRPDGLVSAVHQSVCKQSLIQQNTFFFHFPWTLEFTARPQVPEILTCTRHHW